MHCIGKYFTIYSYCLYSTDVSMSRASGMLYNLVVANNYIYRQAAEGNVEKV